MSEAGSPSERRVVVVGGGLAGLQAALACADGGARVTLLERRPRLGGATWSFEHKGAWFDNGQHVFLRCCTEYRAFLERIGSAGDVFLQDRLSIPVLATDGRSARIWRNDARPPFHLARALLTYRHLGVRDRVRLARAVRALAQVELGSPELDRETFAAWLRRHGQSDRAIVALWDLVVTPTVNLGSDEASATMGAFVVQVGLLREPAAADIGWSRVPLGRLHGDAAARALAAAGADVRSRAEVQVIETEGGAVTGVVVDGARVPADAVVVAVPHDVAAALVPAAADPSRFARLGTSPIVNVHVIYDRRVTELEMAASLGTPVQYVFDRTEAAGVPEGQCLAVSLSAARSWIGRPASEIRDEIVSALARLFPRARTARVVDAVVTRERAATFRAAPGTAALRPQTRTAIRGLYLAGAWTDTGWPATMEGAVRSGAAAARAILHDTGQMRDASPSATRVSA